MRDRLLQAEDGQTAVSRLFLLSFGQMSKIYEMEWEQIRVATGRIILNSIHYPAVEKPVLSCLRQHVRNMLSISHPKDNPCHPQSPWYSPFTRIPVLKYAQPWPEGCSIVTIYHN